MSKVYACSDLHGRYDLYEAICKMLQPEDKVYFLGDACDRGPDGWKLIKAILQNEQWIYLRGNHEDMLIDAMRDYFHNDCCPVYRSYGLVVSNGGQETLEAAFADEFAKEWIRHLDRNLKMWEEYTNKNGITIYMSHAGFTPNFYVDADGEPIFCPDAEKLTWDRHHFTDSWTGEEKEVCLHGHTPLVYLHRELFRKADAEVEPGTLWYCNNHKVCIDNLSAFTNIVCLLDLDTFDEHIIEVKENKNDY